MKKHELKTALKAAARAAGEREFVIIGSQALHAHCRQPPAEVLLSQECDLYPRNHPEAATMLDRQLGRNSAFARKHGYYVDVVSPEIASLPQGWEKRLKHMRVGRITAFCLEIHDLLASKLAVGRLKDLQELFSSCIWPAFGLCGRESRTCCRFLPGSTPCGASAMF